MKQRTFESNKEIITTAIENVCDLVGVGIENLHVSETKAVIDFNDGTKTWFMYSYSRVDRAQIVSHMVDYFLSVKRTDED